VKRTEPQKMKKKKKKKKKRTDRASGNEEGDFDKMAFATSGIVNDGRNSNNDDTGCDQR
jgi:hypothetical protein